MSGRGSRFTASGYDKPKPLIEFFGKTMIEHVLQNLNPNNEFTICVLRDHYESDPTLFSKLKNQVFRLNIVIVDQITQGAAETCLLAKNYINPESFLMIANCDQIQEEWDQKHFESYLVNKDLDGCMFTFFKDSPAYSYVEIDKNGLALRTVEKQVISEHATTGIYVWTKGIDFIWAAERMIATNVRVNNEFYVCPVYNWNIARGDRIGIYDNIKHFPIGTPEDLEYFIQSHPNWDNN